MNSRPPRATGTSAGGLAGAPDALVQLSRRGLGLGAKIAVEHRLERLVVTDGERVIARLVMRAHQQAVCFFVVGVELEELLELEPYDEEAHRLLMRAHHESGEHDLAVRHYQALEAMLHRDLGAEPEPATRGLYQRIRRAG